ncbi:MAG: hypothetical protein LBR53_11260 [Deltaproteobacteria bacterium]|nr:hypothetical protein [Deltaproteobacteria bacterium]
MSEVKLHGKSAGCFKEINSVKGFCRMTGYIESCGKNGIKDGLSIKTLFTKEAPEFIRGQLDKAALWEAIKKAV